MKKGDVIGNNQLELKIESINQLIVELNSRGSIFWRHKLYPTDFIINWSVRRLQIEIKYGNFWITNKIESKKIFTPRKKCDWCNKRKVYWKIHYIGKMENDNKEYRICTDCNFNYDVI